MRTPARKNLFVWLVRVGATLLLAELIAAVWVEVLIPKLNPEAGGVLKAFRRQTGRAEAHPYLNYVPYPNYGKNSPGVWIHHNSLGFRGDEFPREKPKGVFRIMMLGGSATYGTLTDDDHHTLPAQIEASLHALGHEEVQVINGGVFAYSTAESLIELQFRALELRPDMVIMYEAVNELQNRYVPPELFHADNRGSVKRWDGSHFPFWTKSYLGTLLALRLGILPLLYKFDNQIRPATYLGHDSANESAAGTEYKALLRANTPVFYKENLLSMLAICRIRGIRLVLASYGFSPEKHVLGYLNTKEYIPGINEMNEAAREFAAANSVPFLDYQALMPKDGRLWGDEFHVNDAGAAISGRIFADFLARSHLLPRQGG